MRTMANILIVPGVPKVGPKTAAKWLSEFGSLDAIVRHADSIKGAVGDSLRQSLDWLPLGRQLVTIKTDCDLTAWVPGLPAMLSIAVSAMDTGALAVFYARFGFKGLARALGESAAKTEAFDAANPTAPSQPGGCF